MFKEEDMVKIKVSYKESDELAKVIMLMGDTVRTIKLQPPAGKYKRAYIELIDLKDVEVSRT